MLKKKCQIAPDNTSNMPGRNLSSNPRTCAHIFDKAYHEVFINFNSLHYLNLFSYFWISLSLALNKLKDNLDFSWKEKKDSIYIKSQMRNVRPHKVHILLSTQRIVFWKLLDTKILNFSIDVQSLSIASLVGGKN